MTVKIPVDQCRTCPMAVIVGLKIRCRVPDYEDKDISWREKKPSFCKVTEVVVVMED